MFANSHFALATHVLTVLAVHRDQGPVTSAQIARSINTNPAFLRTLLGQLRAAGLIEISLGKGGGAQLARAASRVTLADVYKAVEKRPAIQLHRCPPNKGCVVGRNIIPLLDDVVSDVETAALRKLADTTVADLAARSLRRG
jgi:Rrf2 family protein